MTGTRIRRLFTKARPHRCHDCDWRGWVEPLEGPGQEVVIVAWWLYLAGLVIVCVLIRTATDRWWPATVLAFGPRWMLLAPLVMAPLVLWVRPRLWWTLVAPITAGAVLMNVSAGGLFPRGREGRDPSLRVVTQNVGGGRFDTAGLTAWLQRVKPEIVLFQECYNRGAAALDAVEDWEVQSDAGLCMATRFPVNVVATVDRHSLGGYGNIAARYDMDIEGRHVSVLNVHLETPREGFEAILGGSAEGPDVLDKVGGLREAESALAKQLLEGAPEEGNVLIAGDFNMPVESDIYRRYWGGFANAFSNICVGLGHTKMTRWFGVRIDHVLTGGDLDATDARVGPAVGADHRPMIVQIMFRP